MWISCSKEILSSSKYFLKVYDFLNIIILLSIDNKNMVIFLEQDHLFFIDLDIMKKYHLNNHFFKIHWNFVSLLLVRCHLWLLGNELSLISNLQSQYLNIFYCYQSRSMNYYENQTQEEKIQEFKRLLNNFHRILVL